MQEQLEISNDKIRSLKQVLADVVNSENYRNNGSNFKTLQKYKTDQLKQSQRKRSIFDVFDKKSNESQGNTSVASTIKGMPKWAIKLKRSGRS